MNDNYNYNIDSDGSVISREQLANHALERLMRRAGIPFNPIRRYSILRGLTFQDEGNGMLIDELLGDDV